MKKSMFFLMMMGLLLKAETQSQIYPKGNLFLLGGDLNGNLAEKLVEVSQLGLRDHIVVLPTLSQQPDSVLESIKNQFYKVCANKVIQLQFDEVNIHNLTMLDQLGTAKIILVLNGENKSFMDLVAKTPIYDAIKRAYKNGSTISGGKSLCKYMISEKQQRVDSLTNDKVRALYADNIVFYGGFGLTDSIIVTTNFVNDSKYNQLLSAVYEKPNFDGIGIDDGTALFIHQNMARVYGDGQVIKIANPLGLDVNQKGLIKFQNIDFSVYTDGDSFRLR
ncbi:Type 1 glutamine amidotransferase-like domain-containing protein [Pedobacter sp. SD-b]|uniref:Type 1 glutamine amidotransferase-like domain-containing protein n=1 Tax=Pedobacter segetis TaxID=2793069 RepID=A0ABS1BMR1_9SPHI|nr:Type 1 glutamine amidotransferase-like domain-containing protein [Pedobacter segetis]MBK0384180.1 Type 1 glutamine amidotransferase-like domain-containing protein [Pedobacter segetis]